MTVVGGATTGVGIGSGGEATVVAVPWIGTLVVDGEASDTEDEDGAKKVAVGALMVVDVATGAEAAAGRTMTVVGTEDGAW